MRQTILAVAACLALTAGSAWAAQQTVRVEPGDSVVIACSDGQAPSWTAPEASCPPPTAHAGQPCPQALHDAIATTGPDARQYPTWHPPVDPVSGCYFGHEHGADPRGSRANSAMPPFGYVGATVGHPPEAHEGFKVFIIDAGAVNREGWTAPADIRVVFHMGTSRLGRFTMPMHSMMFDYVARDGTGRYAHVQGMADTGGVSSACDTRFTAGRTFSTLGCPDPYEHWQYSFKLMHPADPYTAGDQVRFTAGGAVAAFDPVTTRDPADASKVVYTEQYRRGAGFDPLLPTAQYRGCNRQTYVQPLWWNDPSRPGSSTVYWTDGDGSINRAGQAPGLLRQEVSQSPRGNPSIFRHDQSYCDATVRAPN